MSLSPPTIIVIHPKEKRSKCSVEPLRGRDDFIFWKFPKQGEQPLDNYVRLGLGGPILGESESDKEGGLLVLDGTWKLAGKMEADYQDVPIRSLPPWQTAYPRHSKLYEDPQSGLATIEAVFIALHLMGRPTDGLLDEYYWKEKFLELNSDQNI